jgi:CheY-like chemotaxis protein
MNTVPGRSIHAGIRGFRPRQILVSEPDRSLRALVREWLEMAGYLCTDGTVAEAAPDVAACCDLALIDIRAPLQSARETIFNVATALPDVPIIAMSADALATGWHAADAVARELGVTAVLVKPFDRDALMRAIERAL